MPSQPHDLDRQVKDVREVLRSIEQLLSEMVAEQRTTNMHLTRLRRERQSLG